MAITVTVPKNFSFPLLCPCCMVSLNLKDQKRESDEVRADENALGFFIEALSGKRTMPVYVPYCLPCSQHIKQYRTPKSSGCMVILLIAAAVIGAGYISKWGGATIGLWSGVALFVAPMVLYFVILRPGRLRKAEALRSPACCRSGPSVTFFALNAFVFHNDAYGKAFAESNGLAAG